MSEDVNIIPLSAIGSHQKTFFFFLQGIFAI